MRKPRVDVFFAFSDAEIAGGIICGCMPMMPQFVRHLGPKLRSVFSSGSLLTKNRFSPIKSSPVPKHRKTPDPYDDSCNLTDNSYVMQSSSNFSSQVDTVIATPGSREGSPDVRNHQDHHTIIHTARDLENETTPQ